MDRVENVIIVGSGPAGYTAALYTARANLEPLVIEGFAWGGLLQQTTDVENYPGFPDGIMGPELMQQFRDQAERFGARLETDDVTRVELSTDGGLHKVYVGDQVHHARAVVLAMGAQHRKLGVAGEEELSGRGVSYCATCDAAFFRDVPTIIVGGGDSAMEEAMFLSKFASKVIIVNRRDEFRASKIMLERAKAIPNIEWLTPYVIDEFAAGENGSLTVARLRNTDDDSVTPARDRAVRSSPIGHEPQSQLVAGPGRARRERLRRHPGPLDADEPPRRVRRRRPRRPHLPPGDHRRRLRLPGRARRRVVPARHPVPGARAPRRPPQPKSLTPGRMRPGAGGRMRPPGVSRMRETLLNRCDTGSRSAGRGCPTGRGGPSTGRSPGSRSTGRSAPSRMAVDADAEVGVLGIQDVAAVVGARHPAP